MRIYAYTIALFKIWYESICVRIFIAFYGSISKSYKNAYDLQELIKITIGK